MAISRCPDRSFGNSLIVSLGMTAGVLILSSLAGYGFSRLEFPGRSVLFVVVLRQVLED